MQVNDKIKIGNDTYIVLSQCGEGGQGSVWKVKNSVTDEICVVKILSEKNPDRRKNKINNINRITNEKLDKKLGSVGEQYGINHVIPIAKYNNPASSEIGYIMEYISGKTLSRMLADGTVSGMSLEQKLKLLSKVARAVDMLHTIGYCYTDISFGNFMYDENTDTVAMIDCENISSMKDILNGKCAFLKGTGFFIAPEVAFYGKTTSYDTDRYALATLMFCFLTDYGIPSPYHGEAMYTAVPACSDMIEVAECDGEDEIDKNWRHFVFDKRDRSNSLDNLAKDCMNPENQNFRKKVERVMYLWDNLPEKLKELFHKAFDNPFDVKRPIASLWVRAIADVLNPAKPAHARANTTKPQQPQQPKPPKQPQKLPVKSHDNIIYNASAPAKPKNAYKPFVPAGQIKGDNPVAAPVKPAISGPCLIGAEGKIVMIADAVMNVNGDELGLRQKELGMIEKKANGYTFTSKLQTAVEVKAPDGKIKTRLCKGQSIDLQSGDIIKPVISTVSLTIKF